MHLPDDYEMDRHLDGVRSKLEGVAQHHRDMLKGYMRAAREELEKRDNAQSARKGDERE